MYNLAPAETARTSGSRRWLAIERKIGSKKDSSTLAFDLAPSSILELEPELASRLDDLRADQWKDRVAILTLWFPSGNPALLVKAEILEKAVPTVKKVGYTHKGHVDYETLSVSALRIEARQGRYRAVGKSGTNARRRQALQG